MMNHIENFQLLQKSKNCFIQNNFNPNTHQLIFTWKSHSIALLYCRRELDNLHGKKIGRS